MQTVSLSGICTKIASGGTPLTKRGDYYGGDIPWLRTQEINFCNIYSTEKTITELGLKHSSAKIIPKDSVIIAMYGATAGKSAINKIPLATNQACCNLIIDNNKADYRFVYYYLVNSYKKLLSAAVGAAQQNLGSKQISAMTINLPLLNQQKKIANILGSLDEKIELNCRMNETLEQLGQALFRHYFVDNPEAKNWSIVKVGDVLSELQSGSRPRGGAVKSGVPSVGAENIVGLGKYDYSKEKYISEEFFNRLGRGVVNSGDVLLYKDGAYVGKKSLFMNGFPHKKCAINEHVFILRTNSRLKSQFFLYFWLDQPSVTKKIIDAGVKAAQPGINQSNVNSLPILLPPEESVKKFDNEISPIMGMIFSNAIESNRLAALRDLLLQKLISGEIEV